MAMCEKCRESEKYNGWANYETWNAVLWLGNDEGLYDLVKEYGRQFSRVKFLGETEPSWSGFLQYVSDSTLGVATPDGVQWRSRRIDHDEMDKCIQEIIGWKDPSDEKDAS